VIGGTTIATQTIPNSLETPKPAAIQAISIAKKNPNKETKTNFTIIFADISLEKLHRVLIKNDKIVADINAAPLENGGGKFSIFINDSATKK
jgi:hypothetical protein